MTAGRSRLAALVLRLLKWTATAIFLAPFYISIVYAFKSKQEITFTGLAFPKVFHLENFVQGIRMSDFWTALANSTITTIPTVGVLTFICCMASYSIARNPRSRFFTAMYYLFLMAILIMRVLGCRARSLPVARPRFLVVRPRTERRHDAPYPRRRREHHGVGLGPDDRASAMHVSGGQRGALVE
jgi:hypothetical protein